MMRNAFYFMLQDTKFLRFLEYLNFRPDFLVMQENCFVGKLMLISKLMTVWETNNCNTHVAQDLKKQRQ